MGTPTIRIKRIRWADNDPGGDDYLMRVGAEGAVEYLVEGVDCEISHEHDPDCHRHTVIQYFRRGTGTRVPNGPLLWGWDGDRERPTLEPSFRCQWPPRVLIHLFLRAGSIYLCGDSTVELAL